MESLGGHYDLIVKLSDKLQSSEDTLHKPFDDIGRIIPWQANDNDKLMVIDIKKLKLDLNQS